MRCPELFFVERNHPFIRIEISSSSNSESHEKKLINKKNFLAV
jgi:hypothetical protein